MPEGTEGFRSSSTNTTLNGDCPVALGRSVNVIDSHFIITVLVFAITDGAIVFRRFLKQNGDAAFGTGFLDRLVPINLVALRIIRAAVKDFSASRFLDDDLAVHPLGM